jgi:hypothetical protein
MDICPYFITEVKTMIRKPLNEEQRRLYASKGRIEPLCWCVHPKHSKHTKAFLDCIREAKDRLDCKGRFELCPLNDDKILDA